MRSSDLLPADIWLEVFGCIPPADIASLASVDSALRQLGRPFLFRKIDVDLFVVQAPEDARMAAIATKTARLDFLFSPTIRPFIRECIVAGSSQGSDSDSEKAPLSPILLRRFLGDTQRLISLRVLHLSDIPLPRHFFRVLAQLSSLTELSLDDIEWDRVALGTGGSGSSAHPTVAAIQLDAPDCAVRLAKLVVHGRDWKECFVPLLDVVAATALLELAIACETASIRFADLGCFTSLRRLTLDSTWRCERHDWKDPMPKLSHKDFPYLGHFGGLWEPATAFMALPTVTSLKFCLYDFNPDTDPVKVKSVTSHAEHIKKLELEDINDSEDDSHIILLLFECLLKPFQNLKELKMGFTFWGMYESDPHDVLLNGFPSSLPQTLSHLHFSLQCSGTNDEFFRALHPQLSHCFHRILERCHRLQYLRLDGRARPNYTLEWTEHPNGEIEEKIPRTAEDINALLDSYRAAGAAL